MVRAVEAIAGGGEDDSGAERLRQHERIAGLRAGLRDHLLRMHGAGDGEAVLRLGVVEGVTAGDHAARFRDLVRAALEDA